jgi:hypothetical protein
LPLMPSIENTNSLVQLNFDFTLHKTEAPPEYRMIGQAISNSRRLNAEDGVSIMKPLKFLFPARTPYLHSELILLSSRLRIEQRESLAGSLDKSYPRLLSL